MGDKTLAASGEGGVALRTDQGPNLNLNSNSGVDVAVELGIRSGAGASRDGSSSNLELFRNSSQLL